MKNLALVLSISMAVICPLFSKSGNIPETQAGRRLSDILEAMASGDEKKVRAVVEEFSKSLLDDHPLERHVDFFAQVYERYEGFDVWRVDSSSEYSITALLQTKTGGDWRRLTVETEHSPPFRVRTLDYRRAPSPEGSEPLRRLTDAELVEQLEAYIDKRSREEKFSGVVLVAKKGSMLFKKAYGYADRLKRIPNQIDTKFNLGSCNKMFTALAIAQLVERGKLSFDDPIIKHLPDYPNEEVARAVTIHHLLTHTSGLGFYPFSHGQKTLEGILSSFVDKPLSFEPGTDMQYSNAGFLVLGLIIEKVAGETYDDYVRRHIYHPAGMRNTDSYSLDEDVKNRAIGYARGKPGEQPVGPELKPNYPGIEVKGSPAGGGYSTAEDMLKFSEALTNHKLLGAPYAEILLSGKVKMGPETQYAYGFGDHRKNGYRYVGHNGGAPGVNAEFRVFLQDGYTIIVLTNLDPPSATAVSEKAISLLAR